MSQSQIRRGCDGCYSCKNYEENNYDTAELNPRAQMIDPPEDDE